MFRISAVSRIAPSLTLLNKGKVVSWMSGRGFGFVEDDADKKQHFVHFSALQTETGGYRALAVGQEVEFEVAAHDGRTRAENVTAPGGAKLPSGPRPPQQGGRGGFGRGGGGRGGGYNNNRDGGYQRDGNNSGNSHNSNFSDEF